MTIRLVPTSLSLGAACALLLLAVRLSAGAAILIDDFNDGNDDGRTHAPPTAGPAVWDATSGAYRLESDRVLSGPNGAAAAYWDDSFSAQSREYNDQQLMDIIATVGTYELVCMMLNSWGVQLDEGLAAFPSKPECSRRRTRACSAMKRASTSKGASMIEKK